MKKFLYRETQSSNLSLAGEPHALLPPANEVCEGYVFTGVCLFTGGCVVGGHAWLPGGHAWLPGGHAWLPGGACMCGCGGGHVWLRRACIVRGVHGEGGMHGKGGHAW